MRYYSCITLQRISEIVYVPNFISSPVIKKMTHLIFLHNPLFIYRMQFLSLKLKRSIKFFHDDVILASALRSYITVADFPSDKYILDCKYVSFCIELNTFIRLGIANSSLFLIFPCCFFM